MEPFKTFVDGKVVSCEEVVIEYPPLAQDPDKQSISIQVRMDGASVRIYKTSPSSGAQERDLVEAIEVMRVEKAREADVEVIDGPGTGAHLSAGLRTMIEDCLDSGIPLANLVRHLMDQIAKVAVIDGMPEPMLQTQLHEAYGRGLLAQVFSEQTATDES